MAKKARTSGSRSLTVYAPASIGNLSVGFDALGLALAPLDGTLLGDLVQVTPFAAGKSGRDWQLQVDGPFAADLPPDPEDNIVLACCRAYQKAAAGRGTDIQPLKVRLNKRLPVGSGLGSSASSIVAALEALNRWHDNLLSMPELFRMMAEMEGGISGEIHLDNVAPCLFGGLRLCPPGSQSEYTLPWPGAWRAVVCWPGTELETRAARAVLPDKLVGNQLSRAGLFHRCTEGQHTGNEKNRPPVDCAVSRRRLLPGFDEARKALREQGALAVGISGSGPTVFALVDHHAVAAEAREWLAANYQKNERGFVHVCRADLGGARSVD